MGRRKKTDATFAVAEPPKEEKKIEKVDGAVKNDYLEVLFYQAKQRDGLLGDFSLNGKYQISNEKILQSLVAVPKLFQEKEDAVLRACTKIGKTTLNFKVDLDINPSYCSAHLSLVEIEHKYDEDIKHVTELGDIVEMYSPLFVSNVMKAWNIKKEVTELDKDDFLVGYLRKQEADEAFLKELSDILAQVYLVRMLKLLESCGEKGLLIKDEYTKLLEELLAKDPGIMQDNSRLKTLLDGIILKHNGFDAIILAGGESVLKGYSFPIDNVRGKDAAKPVVEPEKKQEAEPEKKKEEPVKSASKGSKSKPVSPYKIKLPKTPKETDVSDLEKPKVSSILKNEGKPTPPKETIIIRREKQESGPTQKPEVASADNIEQGELAALAAKARRNVNSGAQMADNFVNLASKTGDNLNDIVVVEQTLDR